MADIFESFIPRTFIDFADIAIVAAVFYLIFSLLRETRSAVALQGLVTALLFCFLAFFLAEMAHLNAVSLIFRSFWIIVVLVFIVSFQHEFKRALTNVGQFRLFRVFFAQSSEFLEELLRAVSMMAKQRIGALIAIERANSLKVYCDTGIPLDALVTGETLRSIFMRPSPLHDGAVIIRGDRILAASCILPLSNNPTLSKDLGTRHRAAVGLSEEADAVVVVVSEDTGIISLAFDGRLERRQTPESLRGRLAELLRIKPEES